MPRYKHYSYEQTTMVAISYDRQIVSGTFEHTLSEVIDRVDLSIFNERYRNDETGAPAYDPRILLKVILFAYSRGIIYSRRIARLCEENVVFMALSADSHPHFTTIAAFVSSMEKEIVGVFRHVLQICMELDLVEGSMFAIDGVKLPCNASKEWSGTKADLRKKKEKLEQALSAMLEQHRRADTSDEPAGDESRFAARLAKARAKVEKLERWLEANDDKVSSRRRTKQSNVTDNESAKMKTSHGVVQGYNAIAVVDSKHQVIVNAEAFGEGQDAQLLQPALQGAQVALETTGARKDCLTVSAVVADTGFHSTDNLRYLEMRGIDGYVPDCNFRKRDPRFTTAARHKAQADPARWGKRMFGRDDFRYDENINCFVCPAGKRLRHAKSDLTSGSITYFKYIALQSDCNACAKRNRCIGVNDAKPRAVFKRSDDGEQYTSRMRRKIDTTHGRRIYSRRMGIIEPVFGNLRWAKGLGRFSVRGRKKVTIQWNLYTIVHNIGKVCTFGLPLFT